MQIRRRWRALGPAALVLALTACEPSEQEQAKFPRADGGAFKADRNISEMHFVQLENGVSFYLKEDHEDNRVAIEVFYNGGYYSEPEGKIEVAHLVEHLRLKGATASYKAGEQIKEITRIGKLAAEVAADCIHFDYIVPADKVGQTLAMEVERITSLDFDQELLDAEAASAAGEFPSILDGSAGSLTPYTFMALNQAYNYNVDFVPIYEGTFTLSIEDVKSFNRTQYRAQDIIVVMVGGIEFATAEALVREHFGALEPGPEPEPRKFNRPTKSKKVRWDLDADATFIIYPGPYGEYRERLMLTMFGVYLNSVIKRSESHHEIAHTTYATNNVYPVRQLPLFVYGMPHAQSSPERLEQFLDERVATAITSVDERMLSGMKRSLTDFVTSTMVSEDVHHHELMRARVIGQEAVNTGIKHLLREGTNNEEFIEMVNSVTLDEMQALLARVCAPEKKIVLQFTPSQ